MPGCFRKYNIIIIRLFFKEFHRQGREVGKYRDKLFHCTVFVFLWGFVDNKKYLEYHLPPVNSD